MQRIHVVGHPLVQRDLAVLRARETGRVAFRAAMRRIARALALRALEDVRCREIEFETPLEPARGVTLDESVALVPIMRAGLGLVDGFLDMLPEARVCHLGIVRDETSHEPTLYLNKAHGLGQADRVFVLDPMLATGGSAAAALSILVDKGISRPMLLCVLAAPEGLERVTSKFREITIVTTAVDRCLDDRAFIRPGLGDAGDRLFDG